MNFTNSKMRKKAQIKRNFLKFFKTQDIKHLTEKNIKENKQMPGEFVREYDKIFKDLLSKIHYMIDNELLVQWFMAGLLQKIWEHLRIHESQSYEDSLKTSQQIKSNDD